MQQFSNLFDHVIYKKSCLTIIRIFPTQDSNPGLPHCRQILYCLSHQGCQESNKLMYKDHPLEILHVIVWFLLTTRTVPWRIQLKINHSTVSKWICFLLLHNLNTLSNMFILLTKPYFQNGFLELFSNFSYNIS